MNTMFSIYDKRQCFWQWDLDQKIVVANNLCEQVHFAFENDKKSVPCKVYLENEKRVADVPNELLQHSGQLVVYAYVKNQDGGRTLHSEIFTVIAKPKPDDYVYTETEVWTAEKAVEEAVKKAVEGGDFKGDKGDKGEKGDPGEKGEKGDPGKDGRTPVRGEDYWTPDDVAEIRSGMVRYDAAQNLTEEQKAQARENIGVTPGGDIDIDLTDYVKNTDYATGDKAGVVKVGTGLSVSTDNKLQIQYAEKSAIQNKLGYRNPLVPQFIDDIVKAGITTNQLPLTDAEKQAAKDWLGITDGAEVTDEQIVEAVNAYLAENPIEVEAEIPIDTAEVGQTIVVKAVDENGKPTEWEAADLPSGGGGAEWKLLANVTLEEDVDKVNISTDMNGKNFTELEVSELFVRYKLLGFGTDGYASRYSDLDIWFKGGGTPGGQSASFAGCGNGQSSAIGTFYAIYPKEQESTGISGYGIAHISSGITKQFAGVSGGLASVTIVTTAGLKAGSQIVVYGR